VGSGDWVIARRAGSAALHHAAVNEPITQRAVTRCEVSSASLVLGSTQPDELVDRDACERLGFEVARRRTGGGAVALRPGQLVWLDLSLPRGDPLWVDDVSRSASWLGEAWSAALQQCGLHAEAHGGEPECSRWGRVCCFAAIDRHEVRVGGRKAVGIAQRRRRDGARFQTLAYLGAHDPAEVLEVLAVTEADRADLSEQLRASVEVLDRSADEVVEAFLSSLRRR
jgi:lipoate-protein ligase A